MCNEDMLYKLCIAVNAIRHGKDGIAERFVREVATSIGKELGIENIPFDDSQKLTDFSVQLIVREMEKMKANGTGGAL